MCWAALRRPKVPLFILGRHQYDVVLTDRRLLLFSRRRRKLQADDVVVREALLGADPRLHPSRVPARAITSPPTPGVSSCWSGGLVTALSRRVTAALTATSALRPFADVAVVLTLDAGTTGVRPSPSTRTAGRRDGLPRVPPALPAAGLGRARRRRDLARGRAHTLAEVATALRRPAAGRRDRHHQPARDGRGLGPAHRPAAATARSSGRTGAPRPRCDASARPVTEPLVRARTGLVLDPYFSATKLEWLLTEGGVERRRRPRASAPSTRGCCWNLTGGAACHATEPSNASRTLLFDIGDRRWSTELLRRCSASRARACPRCGPSSGRFGVTGPTRPPALRGPGQRHRRRPAGGAVRPGLLRRRA